MATTDNAAPARFAVDALAEFSDNSCICHMLSLFVKGGFLLEISGIKSVGRRASEYTRDIYKTNAIEVSISPITGTNRERNG